MNERGTQRGEPTASLLAWRPRWAPGARLLLLGAILGLPGGPAAPQQQLRVNPERVIANLQALEAFGGTGAGGTQRLAFSEEDIAAREWVAGLMEAAGLEVSIDGVGNLMGRRAGADPSLAPLVLGSHIDTVPDGGSYDGQVGSIGAVEVAHTLADHGIVTRHPLEVAIFINEEGGKTGSRALIGEIETYELDVMTASGKTIGGGIRLLGGDPDNLAAVQRQPGSVAGYLELHIEQGAVLHNEGIDVGVVEGIVGIKRWDVTFQGFANHAGTTPMNDRRDALVAAARFILAVNEVARTTPGRQVATVGRITPSPGAPNVVPGEVTLSVEIRDLSMDKIDEIWEMIRGRAADIAREDQVEFVFERFYVTYAAPTEERIRALIEASAEDLALTSLYMPSGAGHDAQSIARLGPGGMIFVPSIDGISHSPREYSKPHAIVAGVNVMLQTLLKLDDADWTR